MRPRQAGDEHCCAASSRAPRAAIRGSTPSAVARPHELFEPAFQPRELFTRVEAAPPFRPLLETLLVLSRTRLLVAHARFGCIVAGSPLRQLALPLLVVFFAACARHVDRIHHQPPAEAIVRL